MGLSKSAMCALWLGALAAAGCLSNDETMQGQMPSTGDVGGGQATADDGEAMASDEQPNDGNASDIDAGEPTMGDGAGDGPSDGNTEDGDGSADGATDGSDTGGTDTDGTGGDGTGGDGTGTDGTGTDGTGTDGTGTDGTGTDGTGTDGTGTDGTGTDGGDGSEPAPVVPDLGGADMSDTDRSALILQYMTNEAYAQNWFAYLQSSTDMRPLVVAPSHGNAVRTFVNGVARKALDAWVADGLPTPLVMPNGSVVVKETYKQDATTLEYLPNGTVVMAKIDALDGAQYEGKWFYVRINTANEPSRATTCVSCHNGRGQKSLWPISDTNGTGGTPDALLPYDYLFVPFCYDPDTTECNGPS